MTDVDWESYNADSARAQSAGYYDHKRWWTREKQHSIGRAAGAGRRSVCLEYPYPKKDNWEYHAMKIRALAAKDGFQITSCWLQRGDTKIRMGLQW